MKNVIIKALTKADQLSLTPVQAADLVVEYLEIASELGAVQPLVQSPAVATPAPTQSAPKQRTIDINRTVKKNPNVPAWKTDDLYKHVSEIMDQNYEMEISVLPEGWTKPTAFRWSLVKDPKNMKGVGLILQSVEHPDFKMNYFFSNETETVDVSGAIEEIIRSISNVLRKTDKPIPNSTVPLRAVPSDIASMAGFVGSV